MIKIKNHDDGVLFHLMGYHKDGDGNAVKLPAAICVLIAEYCLHSIHIQSTIDPMTVICGTLDVSSEHGLLLGILRNHIGFRMEFGLKLPTADSLMLYFANHWTLHLPMCRVNQLYDLEYNEECYTVYGLSIGLIVDGAFNLSLTMDILREELSWPLGDMREMDQNGKTMLSIDFERNPDEFAEYQIHPTVNELVLSAKTIGSKWNHGDGFDSFRVVIGQSESYSHGYHFGNECIGEFKMSSLSERANH